MLYVFHLGNLLVFQVCLGARLCQGDQVVQRAQERSLQLFQMMTSRVQGDQEVLEALVDQEHPAGKRVYT